MARSGPSAASALVLSHDSHSVLHSPRVRVPRAAVERRLPAVPRGRGAMAARGSGPRAPRLLLLVQLVAGRCGLAGAAGGAQRGEPGLQRGGAGRGAAGRSGSWPGLHIAVPRKPPGDGRRKTWLRGEVGFFLLGAWSEVSV